MINRELKRINYTYFQLFKDEFVDPILQKYRFHTLDDMLNVIGFGEMSERKLLNLLVEEYKKSQTQSDEKAAEEILSKLEVKKDKKEKIKERHSDNGIIVKGIDNCLVRLSRCCNPVPGDSIVGYITRGRGVSVHRTDCPNVASMEVSSDRMIDVRWADTSAKSSYVVDICVTAIDRSRLLLQIANLIADSKLNMKAINARTTRDKYAIIDLSIEINDRSELDRLVNKISMLDDIVDVSRTVK